MSIAFANCSGVAVDSMSISAMVFGSLSSNPIQVPKFILLKASNTHSGGRLNGDEMHVAWIVLGTL